MRNPPRAAVMAGAAVAAVFLTAWLPGPAGPSRPAPARPALTRPALTRLPAHRARLSAAERAALPEPPGPDRRSGPAPQAPAPGRRAAGGSRAGRIVPAPRPAAARRPWQLAALLHSGPPATLSGYTSVVAFSRRDAWAFGGTNPGGAGHPIAAHWDGRRWRPFALPSDLTGFIARASASGPRNIWALNYFGSYLLHWNGRRWSVARRWPRPGAVTAILARGRSDAWAFGSGRPARVWRFGGRRWRGRPGPPGPVVDASAAGRHAIWAIVQDRGHRIVMRGGRGRWTRAAAGPALAGMIPAKVLAVSGRDVWVIGSRTPGPGIVVAHWNGASWRRYVTRWPLRLERPAPDGRGGIWIPTSSGPLTDTRWILHVSRSGRWTATRFAAGPGSSVGDLALIPGTRSLWGSGGLLRGAGGDAAIWRHVQAAARPDRDPDPAG